MAVLGQMDKLLRFELNTPTTIAGGAGKLDSFDTLTTVWGTLR
jgi:hypothetical protein